MPANKTAKKEDENRVHVKLPDVVYDRLEYLEKHFGQTKTATLTCLINTEYDRRITTGTLKSVPAIKALKSKS